MKLSVKAALFSAAVYPGAGFFLLKKTWLGILFTSVATIAFIVILQKVMQAARVVADKIYTGEANLSSLNSEIATALAGEGAEVLNLAKIIFVLCWLISIGWSYWLGKIAEKNWAV